MIVLNDGVVALYRWTGRSCAYVCMNAILWHSFTGMFVIERRVNGWGDCESPWEQFMGKVESVDRCARANGMLQRLIWLSLI